MSNIKLSSNLFLGLPELKRIIQFLDQDGFRKNILDNSSKFGLIRNDVSITFPNAKVSPDADLNISGNIFKTIQFNEIKGIDSDGLFFYNEAMRQIPVVDDGNWYWLRIKHQYSHAEKGTWNVSADGSVSGSGGELSQLLRGQPNFPSRIRFINAQLNYLDYDVLEIIDDNNFRLSGASFQNENNLKLSVVGTFSYGAPLNLNNREIFNYDSCFYELVPEATNAPNTPPASGFIDGKTFYIARISVQNNQVIVQDKRDNFWETKASFENKSIDYLDNPLIGVEAVKYNHEFTSGAKNIVEMSWSFRSTNWSVNASTNTLTISTGLGGKYKSVNDFQDGDFDGWRLYAPDGTYSIISSSILNGNAIDLQLNVLDVDHFSNDGGLTYLTTQNQHVVITPDAEEVEIIFEPNPSDNISTQIQRFVFPINEKIGRCDVLVFEDPNCSYIVRYRYRNNKEYTGEKLIPSDTSSGYYNESSFDENGNILPVLQVTKVLYTSSDSSGFIILNLSANAYKRFVFKVDKGDIIGTNVISNVSGITNINLQVGVAKNYLMFVGNLSLSNNLTITIDDDDQVDGNEFTIHFDCTTIQLNGFKIIIAANSNGGAGSPLKVIDQGDVYQMLNIDGGIAFKTTCDGNQWFLYQNYDLGVPQQIITLDGQIAALFDSSTGLGKVRGLYGYAICDSSRFINNIVVPDLRDRFLIGQSPSKNVSATGGGETATLQMRNMVPHTHSVTINVTEADDDDQGGGDVGVRQGGKSYNTSSAGGENGAAQPFSILNPYYAVIYAKKVY